MWNEHATSCYNIITMFECYIIRKYTVKTVHVISISPYLLWNQHCSVFACSKFREIEFAGNRYSLTVVIPQARRIVYTTIHTVFEY